MIVCTRDSARRQGDRGAITIWGVDRQSKSEDALIAWIRSRCPAAVGDLPIGIGDDMAMLTCGEERFLVTSDMLMDGVDFDTKVHSPARVGRKALAVSLSDCAAMAVRPRWAMVSVALPNAWTMAQARELYEGIETLARRYEVTLIGGDTNSWDKPLVVDLTVIAEQWEMSNEREQGTGNREQNRQIDPVRRSGMQPGDLIVVTGLLGGSILGHHMDFEPRVMEAKWLAEDLGDALHAMIDLSDGLSTDAHRLAAASECGIELNPKKVESAASDAATELARKDGRTVLDQILNDGEDFELLFAVEPGAWEELEKRRNVETSKRRNEVAQGLTPETMAARVIGRAIAGAGVWFRNADGSTTAIEPRGWQHFVDEGPGNRE